MKRKSKKKNADQSPVSHRGRFVTGRLRFFALPHSPPTNHFDSLNSAAVLNIHHHSSLSPDDYTKDPCTLSRPKDTTTTKIEKGTRLLRRASGSHLGHRTLDFTSKLPNGLDQRVAEQLARLILTGNEYQQQGSGEQ